MRDNDIDVESDELSEDFGRALAAPFSPAIENAHVATFDPAELAQPLDESIGPLLLSRSRVRAEKSDRGQGCRLLRARGERPHGCTAQLRHESAPTECTAEQSCLRHPLRPRANGPPRSIACLSLVEAGAPGNDSLAL